MITIDTYQDSLDGWRVVINSDENTLAELPVSGYGYDTKEKATNAAAAFLRSREEQGLDVEGGGIRRHITPHKGGRTVKRSTDVSAEVNEMLTWLRQEHDISLGDLVEEAARQKYAEMVRSATGRPARGQLWQPCEHPGCQNEPVCMNCMMCQQFHCHCF